MSEAMDALEARVRRQLDRIRGLGEDTARIRVRETNPGAEITVVVDGNGGLLELELSDGISQLSTDRFERDLVETAGMAVRRAFELRAALVIAFNEEVNS